MDYRVELIGLQEFCWQTQQTQQHGQIDAEKETENGWKWRVYYHNSDSPPVPLPQHIRGLKSEQDLEAGCCAAAQYLLDQEVLMYGNSILQPQDPLWKWSSAVKGQDPLSKVNQEHLYWQAGRAGKEARELQAVHPLCSPTKLWSEIFYSTFQRTWRRSS